MARGGNEDDAVATLKYMWVGYRQWSVYMQVYVCACDCICLCACVQESRDACANVCSGVYRRVLVPIRR